MKALPNAQCLRNGEDMTGWEATENGIEASVTTRDRWARAAAECLGLVRAPQRIFPLINLVLADTIRSAFQPRHLYSYTKTRCNTADTLQSVMRWILNAQALAGGIAAYYGLLTGYSAPYPEVTGYTIPTLFDFAHSANHVAAALAAERATCWLLSLQMPSGAFLGGLHGGEAAPSVFNTGQILQGLIRAHAETKDAETRRGAAAAADWLVEVQQPDGSWSGPVVYQERPHSYYSMVAWALAALSEQVGDRKYSLAARKNLDWVLGQFQPSSWIDGINLQGHPNYLHFIAYALQGTLECAILLRRCDAIEAVEKPAWCLLRKFETSKFLAGAYGRDFKSDARFACLTGNAQMSCVWLRLFEIMGDLRYLNAALKMNELLKQSISLGGGCGIAGGVSGSFPIWGRYQPLRYVSWGCKFLADALLLEQRMMHAVESSLTEAWPCAS
jgi:hypothetical protein